MRLWCGMVAVACATAMAGDVVLFDAASADRASLRAQDGASFELKDGLLTVTTAPSDGYPGVCVSGHWDLSRCGRVEVEFVNGGIHGRYTLRLLNAGGIPAGKGSKIFKLPIGGEKHAVIGADLPPDLPELDAVVSQLSPLRTWAIPYLVWAPHPKPGERPNRRAPPGGVGTLDRRDVRQVAVYINTPKLPHVWSVRRIVARDGSDAVSERPLPAWAKMTADQFFPFIDEYGQFKHREWPDKVHADADLARQRVKEEADLAAHPGPKGWDKWGGWADGPQLPATGGFSTTKWNGKWWIVDPDGLVGVLRPLRPLLPRRGAPEDGGLPQAVRRSVVLRVLRGQRTLLGRLRHPRALHAEVPRRPAVQTRVPRPAEGEVRRNRETERAVAYLLRGLE